MVTVQVPRTLELSMNPRGSSKSQTPNPKKAPITKFQMAIVSCGPPPKRGMKGGLVPAYLIIYGHL